MFKTLKKQQKGFTLIEILVVVGILAILLAITLIALNPAKNFASARNTQRSSDVSAILNAIYQYQAANKGALPTSIAGTVTAGSRLAIGGAGTPIDLCADLVPNYIAAMPMDPSAVAPTGGTTACAAGVTAYDSKYTITKTGSRFTIAAAFPEDSAVISVTR